MISTHFSPLDWVIVIGYLGATMAVGLYGRKFVGGIADFLVAGRELGTFLAVATLAATEIGTITFMYYAELGYKTGYASFVNGLIAGLVMIFLGRTGFIVERLRARMPHGGLRRHPTCGAPAAQGLQRAHSRNPAR